MRKEAPILDSNPSDSKKNEVEQEDKVGKFFSRDLFGKFGQEKNNQAEHPKRTVIYLLLAAPLVHGLKNIVDKAGKRIKNEQET